MGGRIFISHSAKDRKLDPDEALLFARTVRDLIVKGLSEDEYGHTVWLDVRSLEPGDEWCAKLNHWLGICDGAVILLDHTSARVDNLVFPITRSYISDVILVRPSNRR